VQQRADGILGTHSAYHVGLALRFALMCSVQAAFPRLKVLGQGLVVRDVDHGVVVDIARPRPARPD
jgi:hypothetical protein